MTNPGEDARDPNDVYSDLNNPTSEVDLDTWSNANNPNHPTYFGDDD